MVCQWGYRKTSNFISQIYTLPLLEKKVYTEHTQKQKQWCFMCVAVCAFFVFIWKVRVESSESDRGTFILVLTEVQNGDRWPSLTPVTILDPQRLWEASSVLSVNITMCRDLVPATCSHGDELWPWLLSTLPSFQGWVRKPGISRRKVLMEEPGLKKHNYITVAMMTNFITWRQVGMTSVHSPMGSNAPLSITNIL